MQRGDAPLQLPIQPGVGAPTLEAAQDAAGVLRQQLATGEDPSKLRRIAKTKKRVAAQSAKARHGVAGLSGNGPVPGSFEDVALRWYDLKKSSWTEGYGEKVMGRLQRHLLPRIGHRQIGDLEPGEVLELCQNVQAAGTVETGRRVCKIVSAVLSRAVVEGLAELANSGHADEAAAAFDRYTKNAALSREEADKLLDQLGIAADARDFAALDNAEWFAQLVASGFAVAQPVGVFPRLELPAEDAA